MGDIRARDVYEAEHDDTRFFLISGETTSLKEIKEFMTGKHAAWIPTLGKGI